MQELVTVFLDDAELVAIIAGLEFMADGANSAAERKLATRVAAKFENIQYDRGVNQDAE